MLADHASNSNQAKSAGLLSPKISRLGTAFSGTPVQYKQVHISGISDDITFVQREACRIQCVVTADNPLA